MCKICRIPVYLILLGLLLGMQVSAQRKRTKPVAQKPVPEATPTPAVSEPQPGDANKNTGKKNQRPGQSGQEEDKPSSDAVVKDAAGDQTKSGPVYFYEFSRPEFSVSNVYIEHDEEGRGTVRFLKKYFDDEISEPLRLSDKEIAKVRELWKTLNFLDSDEDYQYEKDYSHLGNMKFTMRRDGRERSAVFNWTSNPDARALADEYRRIGNQVIWVFEINVARENQPLESARIIDALDLQLRRNDIADPEQLLPFLRELSDDERMPLISRNHAARIARQIGEKIAKDQRSAESKP